MPTEILAAQATATPEAATRREVNRGSPEALLAYAGEHFGVTSLSEIRFGHGVNSQAEISESLADPEVMALELDVDFFDDKAMVYHFGQAEDPLPLEIALEEIKRSDKILKLDFKTRSSIIPGLKLLREKGLAQPVILNADIVDGHKIDIGPLEWGARI